MEELRQESRQLDRRMEALETLHARRVRVLDSTIFIMQLVSYGLTVAHFLHIWSLHGLQFTLIDGVLALHLHSALSAAAKKIYERRKIHRIARDLDGLFENAQDMEIKKAGDVCCICLVTMTTGNVKKVACGHYYHTHCLREVVERARSIEAAKCPLCRAYVLDGRHDANRLVVWKGASNAAAEGKCCCRRGTTAKMLAVQPPPQQQQPATALHQPRRTCTLSLFYGIFFRHGCHFQPFLLKWCDDLPSRAEIRRDSNTDANRNNDPAVDHPFSRRLLILAGAIPMSPEEEAMDLEQLVDMFPQYDRADLLRELRQRGSSEAVVEAVLAGVFSGLPRGGGDLPQEQELPPPRRGNDAIQQETAAT